MSLLVFDTETTGLITSRSMNLDRMPEVIQFSAVSISSWDEEPKVTLSTLIKPGNLIPKNNTKITGITDAMVADKEPFSFHATAIKEMIECSVGVIAHNAAFDKAMIEIEFERLGQEIKWPEVICSIEALSHIYGGRISLTNLHKEIFGEAFAGAHDALNDVLALHRCLQHHHTTGDFPYEPD